MRTNTSPGAIGDGHRASARLSAPADRRYSGGMRLATVMLAVCTTLVTMLPAASAGEGWSDDEVLAAAAALARQLAMPDDKRDTAKARLSAVMRDARWRANYAALPVRGVFAYQMGEGGVIVKVKKGKGLLRWAGEHGTTTLQLKSVTVGAQIGGSSEWGFGLVLGIGNPQLFGGDYDGSTVSATMGGAGTNMMELTRKNAAGPAFHKVYLVGASSGASANAGGGKLTITVVR